MFSDDNPNTIIELTEKYPEFREIYEEGYEICRNTERVMEMFSKELYELDKNTVQYMIDEMRETIERQENLINELRRSIKTIVDFMRSAKIPEEEIRRYLTENCRFLEEEEALLNF